MKVQGSTELSRMLTLQRRSGETRSALDRAAQEMSTGLKASKYEATRGNLARLYSLDRMIERIKVHENTIGVTETKLDVMQLGLQRAESEASSIAVEMLTAAVRTDLVSARHHAEASRRAFGDLVGSLNQNVAGETLFAGTATDRPALRPPAEILAQIGDLVAGLSATEAIAAVEAYFAGSEAPGFATDAYLGSGDELAPTEIGDGVRIEYALRATDPRIVEALKGHALASLAASGGPFAVADDSDRLAILGAAGRTLLAARDGLLDLSANLGSAQASVETAKAQRNAERETYDLARTKILAADPFDAAMAFEAMKSQLESIFTVTARIGTLRFANFMR